MSDSAPPSGPRAIDRGALTAKCRAAYRRGAGIFHLGGAPGHYHEPCTCCGKELHGDHCYEVDGHWFRAECFHPFDEPDEVAREFASVKLRVDIDGLVQRGDAEVADRIQAAVKTALAELSVLGAETLTVYVKRVAVQRDSALAG